MIKKHQHLSDLLKYTLLLFFIGHYGSATMFYHIHEVDGQVYSHSHFFGFNLNDRGIPVTTHSHTANQLHLIQLFHQTTLTAELGIPEVPVPVIRYVLHSSNDQPSEIYLPLQADLRLRAPPAC